MSKRNVEAIYPLSPMQQGMLFHSLYAPETGVYFEQLRATLIGPLDRAAFERAWGRVVERHAVLRTAFSWKSLDRMLQIVHRQVALPIDYQDWRGAPEAERDARLEAYLQADRQRGFDLGRAPLLRLALLRLADDRHILVWSHHHLLLDGWSMPLLLKEVFAFYEAFRQGRDLALEPARPYRDYIAWLGQQDLGQAEAYWRRTLRGFTTPTPLVVDRPGAAQPATAEERERRLSEPVTQALQTLARQRRLTLSTILQGAWALLLHRYSGEADVLFGATVSGRPPDLPGVEGMIGVFINTLPVRVRVRPEQPVVEWLQTLQAQAAEMRQYEYSPLVQVQGWSEAPRDRALFESLLIFENYPVDEALREPVGSLRVEGVQSREQTNYPLNLISGPGRSLTLKVSYDPQRFDADVIERLLGHLQTLLEGIAAGPERPVADVPLLTEAEAGQLAAWSRAEADLPVPGTVLDLFAAQAAHKPEAAALIFAEPGGAAQTLTYGELDRRSNRLAHALRARGVGPEALVALCVERSLEMIIGLLGSLKAGGAYLPLDPSYPPERLAYMLQDSGARVLITQSHLVPRLSGAAGHLSGHGLA